MPIDDVKTERLMIRFTTEQRERWERAAAADRRTLTDWIRIQLDDAAERQLAATEKPAARKR
ncbi:MAG: DUF1778 domain-containing protein [Planctomycetaceae bacterium]|nr:DUF1778 domain-containing protein [Planctomycetaceae bacterium]